MGAVSGGSSGSMEPLDFFKWPYGTTQVLKMVLEIVQFLRKTRVFGNFFSLGTTQSKILTVPLDNESESSNFA